MAKMAAMAAMAVVDEQGGHGGRDGRDMRDGDNGRASQRGVARRAVRRVALLGAGGAFASLLSACGQPAPPPNQPKDLQHVGEPQVHRTTGKELHITGAVRNTGRVAHEATVRVRLLDPSGNAIVTSDTFPIVQPGSETTYLVVVFPERDSWARAEARIVAEK